MERNINIMVYLLTRLVASAEGMEVETLVEEIERQFPKPKRAESSKETIDPKAVDRIYALYPTKCPISKRATGKSSTDKRKIERLLLTRSEEELSSAITRYLEESKRSQSYIKNFSTFLNNIPDYSDSVEVAEEKEQYIDAQALVGGW